MTNDQIEKLLSNHFSTVYTWDVKCQFNGTEFHVFAQGLPLTPQLAQRMRVPMKEGATWNLEDFLSPFKAKKLCSHLTKVPAEVRSHAHDKWRK